MNQTMEPARPTVVCLCGSTRFSHAFREANLRETLAGRIVLTIGCDMRTDEDLFAALNTGAIERIKADLDELHKRKIDLADEILVLNVGGYIGDSTRAEVAYAQAHGKRVRWLEPHTIPAEYNDDPQAVLKAEGRRYLADALPAIAARMNEIGASLGVPEGMTFQIVEPVDAWSTPVDPADGPTLDTEAVHGWFNLTYSNYLVLPRTLMQSMPAHWQTRIVALLEEIQAAYAHIPQADSYHVQAGHWAYPGDLSATELADRGWTTFQPPTETDDDGGRTIYYDPTGDEHDGHTASVFIPTEDPIPHYNRGRTRIEPSPVGVMSTPVDPTRDGPSSAAPTDVEERAEDAARRFAGQLVRLQSGLTERGWTPPGGTPVDEGWVDLALEIADALGRERQRVQMIAMQQETLTAWRAIKAAAPTTVPASPTDGSTETAVDRG